MENIIQSYQSQYQGVKRELKLLNESVKHNASLLILSNQVEELLGYFFPTVRVNHSNHAVSNFFTFRYLDDKRQFSNLMVDDTLRKLLKFYDKNGNFIQSLEHTKSL